MDNRILAHRGWRVTDGLVGSFEMLRAEQGLRDACSSGNRAGLREITEQLSVEKLDQLLSNGRDYPTGTPVFEAILCEQAGILEDLIGLGCDLEQECSLDIFFPVHFVDTGPALSVACAMGNTRCVSVLLKAGACVNHAGQNTTPLLSACQDGNTDLINLLLEAGADPNLSPRALPGHTALHVSCLAHDDIDNVRLLIAYGADVNKSDKDGEISAFKACTAANWNVAELLLQNEDLLSSSEDIVKMFWVLGAECLVRLENHDLTDKYWTWAATLDPDFSIYNNMVEKLLSPEQVNAGIHQALHSSADLTALLRNQQQVELQALVFLYLVFRWGKETISCRTGLISSALRKQQPWLTCKLLMFSENMTDSVSCYDVSSLCENISQTVEDLLELYFVDKRQSKEHLNVIITGIISQILRLFEKVVKSSDLGVKKALKLSHLQCTQMKPKQERAQQLIEAFLGLVKFGHSLTQDLDVLKQYNDKLRKFCQLCELPSAKQAKLNCTTWQVVVSGGPCCKHSLTWQHHNLFPCPSITQLLSDFGLDINCRDLNRNTPLHDALLCLEPSREVVQTLVKNGAEIDLPNKDGIRPYSILSKNLCYSVNVVEFTSLKSLASQVVIKHKVPYLEILPKTLAEFVQARDVNQANNGFWKT